MRPFDPRAWNLVAASSLALAACEKAGHDQDASSDDVQDDSYDDGYDGYQDDYSDGRSYECYDWTDCDFGYMCFQAQCSEAHEIQECMHEPLAEIPLPELEPAVAITFADLDGDGDDELVSIGANGISVVLADDSVVLTPWPEPHDPLWVTPLELQADGFLDLAVGFTTGMLLFGGTGDGSFAHLITHVALPTTSMAKALDPQGDGIDQLVAANVDGTSPIWFTHVLSGAWLPINGHVATAVTTGELWGEAGSPLEILAERSCGLTMIDSGDFGMGLWLGQPMDGWDCDWHVATWAGMPGLLGVSTDAATSLTELTLFDPVVLTGPAAKISNFRATTSTLIDLQGNGELELALASESNLALVWDFAAFPLPCHQRLDGAADSLAAGDRDGDGRQELAVLDTGTIRLLHLP